MALLEVQHEVEPVGEDVAGEHGVDVGGRDGCERSVVMAV